jgi:energy-coupling factor transporter ATP-binding protein EcfA2
MASVSDVEMVSGSQNDNVSINSSNQPQQHNDHQDHEPMSTAIVPKSPNDRHKIFSFRSKGVYQQLAATSRYVEELEALLKEHSIPLPPPPEGMRLKKATLSAVTKHGIGIMKTGGIEELKVLMSRVSQFHRNVPIAITYRDINYWTMAPETQIATVGNSLYRMFCGSGPKHRVDILKGLTGRVLPTQKVLLLGPPGCGKSVFMQALSGRLRPTNGAKLEGAVCFNGENVKTTDKFIPAKVADYCEQNDTHAPTLTVEETLKYAWMSTTGGHHGYGIAKDEQTSAILNDLDAIYSKVSDMGSSLVGTLSSVWGVGEQLADYHGLARLQEHIHRRSGSERRQRRTEAPRDIC